MQDDWQGVGQVPHRTILYGSKVDPTALPGTARFGTQEQFANGVTWADRHAGRLTYPPCLPQPPGYHGEGEVIDGGAGIPEFIHCCGMEPWFPYRPVPERVYLTIQSANDEGPVYGFDGSYVLLRVPDALVWIGSFHDAFLDRTIDLSYSCGGEAWAAGWTFATLPAGAYETHCHPLLTKHVWFVQPEPFHHIDFLITVSTAYPGSGENCDCGSKATWPMFGAGHDYDDGRLIPATTGGGQDHDDGGLPIPTTGGGQDYDDGRIIQPTTGGGQGYDDGGMVAVAIGAGHDHDDSAVIHLILVSGRDNDSGAALYLQRGGGQDHDEGHGAGRPVYLGGGQDHDDIELS